MTEVVIDEVAIDIVPELGHFLSDLRRGALPAAEQVGREIGAAIGKQISQGVVDGVLDGLRKAKARAAGAKVDVEADLDTTRAEEKLERLERSGSTVELDADVETAAAEARVRAFRDREEHNAITIPVRTNSVGGSDRGDGRDSSGRFVGSGVAGAGGGGGAAAGGINQLTGALGGANSGMGLLIALGISLAPAIVPAAAAAAGAIAAIGAAASVAGAAAGVLALGFSGISDAYGALNDQSKKAGASAGKLADRTGQIQSALERVQSAQRALANVQADAADAAIRNAERTADADRREAEATEALQRAQEALTEARRDAQDAIEDLNLSVAENATAQGRAALTLRKAQADLAKTNFDESKTDDDRLAAQFAVDEALQNIERQKLAGERLSEQKAESDKVGVEGSKQVVAATRDVADAQQAITDAQRDQVDTAREVAAAQRQSATAIIEATLAETQAQRAYQDALTQTGASGGAAANKVAQAFKELSPAGQEFVNFLFTQVKPAFDSLKFTAQENLLPGVQAALESLAPLLPKVNELVAVFARTLGGIAQQVADALNGPEFAAFLQYLIDQGPKILGYLTTIGLSLGKVFATLIVALGPSTDAIIKGFADFLAYFAEWVAQVVQTPEFQAFIDYIITNAPTLGALLFSLLVILIKLAIAFAPFGATLLDGITKFFGFLASLDPDTLLLIFTLVAVAIGAIALVIGGPAGVVVAIVALVAALVGLVSLIADVAPAIGDFFASMWNDYIKPALDAFWEFLTHTIPQAVVDLVLSITNGFSDAYDAIVQWLSAAWTYITDLWEGIKTYIGLKISEIESAIYNGFAGAYDSIAGWLKSAGDTVSGWLNTIVSWVSGLGGRISDAARGMWDGLVNSFKGIANYIIDIWNWLADSLSFNGPGSLDFNLPHASHFADGGIYPGYTPGRDIGLAAVSGGEAIMRPEWTRAVGPQYVHAANAAARSAGVAGVQSFLGAMGGAPRFATGGIYRPPVALPVQRNIGQGTPTGGAAQPLIGSITLVGSKATTRQDAQLVANEIGWQARIGTGLG